MIARVDPSLQINYIPYREAYGHDFEDVRRRVPDVSKLKQTIGTAPGKKLDAILDDVIKWKQSERE